MTEDKPKCKKCWNCGNYQAYYTKGFCHFDSVKVGNCTKHMKIVKNKDSCEFWRNTLKITNIRKTIARRALVDILISLSALKQILQEEAEREENEIR